MADDGLHLRAAPAFQVLQRGHLVAGRGRFHALTPRPHDGKVAEKLADVKGEGPAGVPARPPARRDCYRDFELLKEMRDSPR